MDFLSKDIIAALLKGRRVLFITHKKPEYIRNAQEIKWIHENAATVKIISANAELTWSNYFFSIIKVFLRCLFLPQKNYELVFIAYLPQFILPALFFVFRKKIVVIDFFISLYDTIVFDKKLLNPRNPLALLLYWMDKISLCKADYCIADTKTHAAYFMRQFAVSGEKLAVLYLAADRSIYYPRSVPRPPEWKNKYLVLYFGSVLPLQGVEVIFEAARLLQARREILFIFIGPLSKKLEGQRIGLNNMHFISWLPQARLADYIALSDLCLAGHFHGGIEKARRVIPGKAYIYQAMQKPMILGENSANREIFSAAREGVYFVKMGDARALADTIISCREEAAHGH